MKKLKSRPLICLLTSLVVFMLIYIFRYQLLVWIGHEWYGWIGNRPPKAGQEVKGRLENLTFKSELLGGIDRTVTVYLPYNYDSNSIGNFPVVYLLHGFAGVKEDWLIDAKIVDVAENAIAGGKLPPVIMVMPDGNGPLVKDSEYLDATLISQPMESHLVKELIPFIDGKYRTIREARGRAVMGVSTGAYGAVNLTFHHPDLFAYVLSLGGYFINRESSTWKLLGDNTENRQYNEPLYFIDKLQAPEYLRMYFVSSSRDYKDFLSDNERLTAKLTEKKIDNTLIRVEGGHFWGPWNRAMPDALNWLGTSLRDEL